MDLTRLPPHLPGDPATYDHVLVGAGAAGLSLALELVARFPDARLLLVDPGFADLTNRTFAFWCEGPPPFASIVARSWDRVRLADGPPRVPETRALVAPLDRYRYHVVTGTAFRDHALARLRATGRVHYLAASARQLEGESEDHVRVVTDHGDALARWAFDSRLDERRLPLEGPARTHLVQRFMGWEIETDAAHFDDTCPILFDFRVPAEGDQRFVYVLPFTRQRALVELVTLAPCDPTSVLEAYVHDVLGIDRYRVVRREAGDSPLTAARFVRREGRRVLRIGNAGGMLKPSSGYAFTRIVADSRAIADSLAQEGHPFALPPEPPFVRMLDGLFLRVTQAAPARMAEVFLSMFATSAADRVLHFLDERASVPEIVQLGLGLPIPLFAGEVARAAADALRDGASALGTPPDYEP